MPSTWRPSHRARWPSTPSTSRRSRGGWSRDTDPERAEDNLEERDKHQRLWRKLKLTMERPDSEVDTGGLEYDDRQGAPGGGGELQGAGVTPQEDGVLLSQSHGEANLNSLVILGGHATISTEDEDHLPGGHVHLVHGGGEQGPAAPKKRKYNRKLRGGQSRDGIKQTAITTFTVPKIIGVGGGSGGSKTKTGD